ncbi:MAG: potassium transporter Kef [Polyangia bacterium]
MNTLVLVMGLVGLSYLSGLLGRGRSVRGLGLPSGSEWIVLGFLLGPDLLGIVDRAVQLDVEPVLYISLGWVALVIGVDYGVVRTRYLSRRRLLLGAGLGLLTVGCVATAAWFLIPYVEPGHTRLERWVLALGLGAVASETTSNAVRWVAERHAATGPLSELLDDLAEAKEIAPILVACVGLCLHPRFDLGHRTWLNASALPIGLVAVGIVLGLVASVMLSREERTDQSWGILVGIGLLAAGTAARARLPVVAALFALGMALGFTSRHRRRILAMIEPTRRSALVPALLLAGARIGPQTIMRHALIVGAVLVVRVIVLHGIALFVRLPDSARAATPLIGWSMMPAGEITMCIGLSFALTFRGNLGDTVLLTAAIVTLVGEIIGPLSLRAALMRAGEIQTESVTAEEAT